MGRQVLEEEKGEYSKDNPDGINQNEGYPIYNYAYPLYGSDVEDDTILRVCQETSCTVLYNNDEGRYYLALTGCGMDLSQDITLAYLIVDGCIEWAMLEDVYIDEPMSVSPENYVRLLQIWIGNLRP